MPYFRFDQPAFLVPLDQFPKPNGRSGTETADDWAVVQLHQHTDLAVQRVGLAPLVRSSERLPQEIEHISMAVTLL